MKNTLFTLLLLMALNVYGQQRAANWFFGYEAGLNFSTGEPVAITLGKLQSIEGSSSISDTLGNLLFYTNGERICNRNHELMSNTINLLGNQSAIQTSIIAPLPNNDVLYYLFTTAYPRGLHYSIVDMSLNNGLGEISDTKNVLLQGNGGEELAGTLHWIVSRELTVDELIFHAHLLTENGIDNSIVSRFKVTGTTADDRGCITLSQNGTKLVYTTFSRPIYIFDFCLSTGLLELTDSIAVADNEILYTNALSPNAKVLYTTSWVIEGDCLLSQYNLMAENIADTRVNLDFEDYRNGSPNGFGFIGHVKLAPDQKIYVSKWHQKPSEMVHPGSFYTLDSLAVINQPDNLGLACEYEENAVYLNGKPTMLGLPNFISNFTTNNNGKPMQTKKSTQDVDLCLAGEIYILPDGVEVELEGVYESIIPSSLGCDSLIVTNLSVSRKLFQNEVSLCAGESYTLENDSTVFEPGIYRAKVFDEVSGCDNIYETIVNYFAFIQFTQDTSICEGQKYQLPNGVLVEDEGVYQTTISSMRSCDSIINTNLKVLDNIFDEQEATICEGQSYILPNGIEVELEGVYESAFLSIQGCDSIITTNLKVFNQVFDEQEANICLGESYILPDGVEVELEGVYESTITSTQGCDSIITTDLKVFEQIFDDQEANICLGESYILPDGIEVELEGIYESTIKSVQGCDSIITTIVKVNTINISLPIELVLESDSIELVNEIESSNPLEYLWSPPEGLSCFTCPQPMAGPTESITYLLEVKDLVSGCTKSASVNVVSIVNKPAIPNAFSPNEDGVNDYFIVNNIPSDAAFLLVIYNRLGQKVFETKDVNTSWDGTFNNEKQPLGVYVWLLQFQQIDGAIQQLKGNVTLVR